MPQHEPCLLPLQLLSHPSGFSSFPHRPLPLLLLQLTPPAAAQLSFAHHQSTRGRGPHQLTAKQSLAIRTVSFLLPHATFLLPVFPQVSPPFT